MTPDRRVTWQATSDGGNCWPHSAARPSRGRSRRAGKPAFVSMIGLLSSRPPFGRIEPAAEIGSRATAGRPLEPSARRNSCSSGVGARTGLVVAAADSPSLLPELAPPHPTRRHTGTPVRDGLRLIDAQLHTARCYLP